MIERYNHKGMSDIWSPERTTAIMEKIWIEALKVLEKRGFKDAFKTRRMSLPTDSGHEVIDILHGFINKTGYVNAHMGFTSSDVIDNVRLIQCHDSVYIIRDLLSNAISKMEVMTDLNVDIDCLGYTHWQPATRLYWSQRIENWASMLRILVKQRPIIHEKKVGGAVGTREALEIISDDTADIMVTDLNAPYETCMQSTPYYDELVYLQWLSRIGAWMSKICLDIRFLCHTGELGIMRGEEHKGSSAMPGKNNPKEAEKICSLARLLPGYERALWDAMANNGLERTLDGSASSRVALMDASIVMGHILETFSNLLPTLSINKERCDEIISKNKERAKVELKVAEAIKGGMSRVDAYKKYDTQI